MNRINVSVSFVFLTILLVACSTSDKSYVEYRHKVVQPVLQLREDLKGEAPKRIINCIYQFYAEHHRWPDDYSEFKPFALKEGETDDLADMNDMKFNPQSDGSCELVMQRIAYTIQISLPKP